MNDVTSYGGSPQNYGNIKRDDEAKKAEELQNPFNPKHVKGLGEVDSTLTSLSSQAQVKEQYLAPTNRPVMSPPTGEQVPFDKDVIGPQIMQKFAALKNMAQPNATLTNTVFEEQLSSYAQQKNLNNEEVAKIRFAFYYPDATEDPQVKADAQFVENSTNKELQQKYNLPPSAGQKPEKGLFNSEMEQAYSNAFEDQLAKLAQKMNLTKEQVNQLRFAHNNPGTASPEIQKMLENLEKAAIQVLRQQFGLPAGWKPQVNSKEFNANVEVAYDKAFENALQNQIPPLTEAQKGMLRFMHYNPGAKFPGSEEMQQMLHTMELSTLNALKSSLGLPQGFTISPATQYFSNLLNASFQVALKDYLSEFLDSVKPPMNKKDQELLERALENPDDPTIPPEIKALAAQIQGRAIKAVREKYSLPEVWTPETLAMLTIPVNAVTTLAKNGIAYLQDFSATTYNTVLKLPPSPEKFALIDFLKVISDALSFLKQSLYQITSADSLTAKKITEAKLEDQKQKLKFFEEAQKVAKEQAQASSGKGGGKSSSTQKFLSIFTKVITPMLMVVTFVITAVMIICTGGAASPLALAFAIVVMTSLTALMIADNEDHTISKFFVWVSDVLDSMMPDWVPDSLREITKIFMKVVLIMVVLLLCCTSFTVLMTIGLEFALTAFMQSNAVQDGIAVCGGDEKVQAICAMVIGLVLAIAICILSIASSFIGPPGVGAVGGAVSAGAKTGRAAAAMAKMGTQIAGAIEKIAEKSQQMARCISNLEKIFAKVCEIEKRAVQFIQKIVQNAREDYEFLEKAARWAKEGIEKIAKGIGNVWTMRTFMVVETSMSVTAQALQIQQGIIDIQMKMELAALALMAGNLEAAITEIEALIKSLTKLINLFLDGLANLTDWMKNIDELQARNWKDASTQMTHLMRASQA